MTRDQTPGQTPRNDILILIHVDILDMCTGVRAPPKKMKYSQNRNEIIKNVLNSRLENPKNETYIARNLTLDVFLCFTFYY
jgi:hypothetical protein